MPRGRWGRVVVVALLSVLMACVPGGGEPTPSITSSAPPVPSSATPTPSSQDVEQAMAMYRQFTDLHWQYLTKKNGLGANEEPPPELTDLLTGDALESEVSYLKRWRAQGWRVVSGERSVSWLEEVDGATWGDSVVAIQGCVDSTDMITTNASGEEFSNRAFVTTAFYERAAGALRISYFDRTKVGAVAPCGPSASPSPSA